MGLRPLVGAWFQVLLSPRCSRCFSPFPHGTGPLSVSRECLALPDGAGKFKRGVSDPALLRVPPLPSAFPYGALTLSGPLSHAVQVCFGFDPAALLPPASLDLRGLGSCAFARHYLRNHCCFLFLRVLRCFSSPGLPPLRGAMPSAWRVAPFGHLRISPCLRVPAAFRSLPRPSSPPRA